MGGARHLPREPACCDHDRRGPTVEPEVFRDRSRCSCRLKEPLRTTPVAPPPSLKHRTRGNYFRDSA
jgi:hypothetical protein